MNKINDAGSIIQKQLDAYNSRDIEALLGVYSDDAQMFEHPSKLLASGKGELRARFMQRFSELNLHAQLVNRVAMGNYIIDHEKVTRTFPEGPGIIELIMIYEVKDGRISKAWVISGAKEMSSTK